MSTTSWATPTAPLSDEEILQRYSGLLWEGLRAFATDPTYAAEMVEAASMTAFKQRMASERKRLAATGLVGDALNKAVRDSVGTFKRFG